MERDIDNRKNIIAEYKPDTLILLKFLPWLMQKREEEVVEKFNGAGDAKTSFGFPVYDATLMNFVKTAQKTIFMNRNYQYVYSKNFIYSYRDEIAKIQNATLRDMDLLGGILSKYIMGGMTRGDMWPAGVKNGVYVELLTKLKELCEITHL